MGFNKEFIINNKNIAIKNLENYLNNCIESNTEHQKKANLLSFWIQDYVRYIEQEETFNSYLLTDYKYGDVIKANLGFNVGNEEGGLHYCIVMDKYNAKQYSTLTVIPLTSVKTTTKIRKTSVFLGDEIRLKIHEKANKILDSIDKEKAISYQNKVIEINKLNNYNLINDITEDEKRAIVDCKNKIEIIEKILNEAEQMKKGSIALVNQITTISKQRIYNPKNDLDILHGITISENKMQLIKDKVQKLFL